jgi:dihydroorotase-like cyclic amidohydrolase
MARTLTLYGMVDPHVHLRGMEWSHKGTFATETAAVVAGGYWAVLDMPNTLPSTINRPDLEYKRGEFASQAVCDWGVYYGASTGENWRDYDETLYHDVCGLKIYNNETTGVLLIDDQNTREQHYMHWNSSKPIAVHAEEDTVLAILALVRKYRRFTHFCHISSAREIRYLTDAKGDGLPISIGVCPHHLWLTRDDLPRLGSLGLMKPELETRDDQEALWEAIQRGVVDVIESDHAPHLLSEKQSEKPPFGVPGLETTLPLLLTAVHEGRLTLEQVRAMVCENPRRIFGLDCPPDTYTVIDLDASYVLDRSMLHTKCGWSPFEGMRLYGRVMETWIRGIKVYDGERVLVQPGFGQSVTE